MPWIFISYRRIDTLAWAGRLFADLRKSFGMSQVFMDINGGIPRGADFEQALTTALEGCEALLVLIGPQWTGCTRSDGTRRLDAPDDWVRNEISTALRRNITVIPVLLGGAPFPGEAELPEDLRALRKRQRAEVTDKRWDYDIGELIKDLIKQTSLRPLDDVVSANTSIRLLKDRTGFPPASSGPGDYFFISYKREDSARLSRFMHQLVEWGHKIWYDRGIPGGAEWDAMIEARIKRCKLLILFITKAAIRSKNVRKEVKYADSLDKPLIAVRLEEAELTDGLAMLLGSYQMIDATTDDCLEQLRVAIEYHLNGRIEL